MDLATSIKSALSLQPPSLWQQCQEQPECLHLLHEPSLGLSFGYIAEFGGELDGFIEERVMSVKDLWVHHVWVDTGIVINYARLIQQQEYVEPILVVMLADDTLVVWDGHHRLTAHALLELQTIEVYVYHHAI